MIDRNDWRGKRVLLLQGPLGPFFARLARDLRAAGADVQKINFNGGDQFFSPDGIPYTGTLDHWPTWLEALLVVRGFDAVALFGDRRPVHDFVAAMCRKLGVDCYVFEEGYFRPAYITCELGGVNARSTIPRDPEFYLAHAEQEPTLEVQPPANAYWYMVLWTCVYYFFSAMLWPRYRHYRHHRPLRLTECLLWVRGSARKWWRRFTERRVEQLLTTELSGKFFLVPLQVHNDAQVTHNSRFGTVEAFIAELVASFARDAAPDVVLVFKHHPMDRAYRNYGSLIRLLAEEHGLQGRLLYIHDQHLPTLLDHALGVVVINSTAGLSAIHQGVPTITLGDAFYDMQGLTCQAPLHEFWVNPSAYRPVRDLYLAYRRWVIKNAQINDNFYAGPLRGAAIDNEVHWRASADRTVKSPTASQEQLS